MTSCDQIMIPDDRIMILCDWAMIFHSQIRCHKTKRYFRHQKKFKIFLMIKIFFDLMTFCEQIMTSCLQT